jgi:type III secretory pathway component EscS
VAIVLVLLCCCCVVGAILYNYSGTIMNTINNLQTYP